MALGNIIRKLSVVMGVQADTDKAEAFERVIDDTAASARRATKGMSLMGGAIKTLLTGAMVGMAVSAANAGAEVLALSAAYEQLGGNAEDMDRLREATLGAITDKDLTQLGNTAALFGFTGDEIGAFAEIAVGASLATGESINKMLGDITTAGARGSAMIADNLAILVSVGEANDAYAAQIGKTAATLTKAEQAAAFRAALIANATKQRALAQGTLNNEVVKLITHTANLKDALNVLIFKALNPIAGMINNKIRPGIKAVVDHIKEWFTQNNRVQRSITAVNGAVKILKGVLIGLAIGNAVTGFVGLARAVWSGVAAFKAMRTAALLAQGAVFLIPLAIGAIALGLEDVFVWLSGGESALGDFIAKFQEAEGPLGDMARWFRDNKEVIRDLGSTVRDFVKDDLKGVLLGAVSALGPIFTEMSRRARDAFGILSRGAQAFGQIITENAEPIRELAAVAMDVVRQVWDIAAPIMESILNLWVETTKALMPPMLRIGKAVMKGVKRLMPTMRRLVTTIVRLIKRVAPVVMAIVAIIVAVISKAIDVMVPVIVWIIDKVVSIFASLLEVAEPVMAWLLNIFDQVSGGIAGFIGAMVELPGTIADAVMDAWDLIVDSLAKVIAAFADMGSKIGGALGLVWDGVKEGFRAMVIGLLGLAEGMINGVIGLFNGMIDALNSVLGMINDIANKIPGLDGIDATLSHIATVDITSSLRAAEPAARALTSASTTSNTSQVDASIGQVQVNIRPEDARNPGSFVNAIESQVQEMQRRRAARDLATG